MYASNLGGGFGAEPGSGGVAAVEVRVRAVTPIHQRRGLKSHIRIACEFFGWKMNVRLAYLTNDCLEHVIEMVKSTVLESLLSPV